MNGKDINFTDWNKDRYIQELTKGAESKDALTKYYVKDLIAKIDKQSGQYRADPYVYLFSRTLENYRSSDDRTMYIGVTGINIYSGDNNFVFSLHVARKESQASVLSYYMMTADKDLGELIFRLKRVSSGVALIRMAGLSPDKKADIVRDFIMKHLKQVIIAFTVITPTGIRIRKQHI